MRPGTRDNNVEVLRLNYRIISLIRPLFLCDFLGASGFFCQTGLGGGQGDACTVPPCAVCGVEMDCTYILLVMIYIGRTRVMKKQKKELIRSPYKSQHYRPGHAWRALGRLGLACRALLQRQVISPRGISARFGGAPITNGRSTTSHDNPLASFLTADCQYASSSQQALTG